MLHSQQFFGASLHFQCKNIIQKSTVLDHPHLRHRSGVEAADGPTDGILEGLTVKVKLETADRSKQNIKKHQTYCM